MKKQSLISIATVIIMVSTFSVPSAAYASENNINIDVSKFCVKNFCIGDPLGKLGGINKVRGYTFVVPDKATPQMHITRAPKLKKPDCEGKQYDVLPYGEDVTKDTYIVARIMAFPGFLDRDINEYYRVSALWVSYKRISGESQEKLNQEIFGRAGIAGERGPLGGSLHTPLTATTNFGGLKLGSIEVSAQETYLYLIASFDTGFFSSVYKEQIGCTSAAPKL